MNKAELVQALAERLDADRRVAAAAVDGLLDVIVRAVQAGDTVSVTGFGVFERRERAARSARNPRTGAMIDIPATRVPAFRPGATFRDVVSGARELGEPSVSRTPAPRPVAAGPAPVNGAAAPVPVATAVGLAAPVTDTPSEPPAAEPATGKKARPTKAAKPTKAVKAAKPAKPAKSETADKPDRAGKPAKNDKPDKTEKGRKKGKK